MIARLPDKRLSQRLEQMVDQLSQRPEASIPQVFESWHDVKAAYHFLSNERVTHEAIIAEGSIETRQRLQGLDQVLLVQDTVSFNFTHHPATEGLGRLENDYISGFFAHNTLAVSPDGVPLGLLNQNVWVRDQEKSESRRERPFDEKESYKWVEGLAHVDDLPDDLQPIVVCDAEAHIYDFLDELHDRELDYIVRGSDYRSFTPEGQPLFETVAQQAVQHTFTLQLKRHPERPVREAQLELRFGEVRLRRPQRSQARQAELTVWVVDVQEIDAPAGEEPIHWLLLTSLPVTSVAQAQQIVTWYSHRWLVERFHYVLKSGCQLEESQLRQADRLQRLLGVYSLVAWRLLWLTYQARVTPNEPCTVALTEAEWQALYLFMKKTTRLPKKPPSLRQATRWIGQLGGFLGRKGDGEPGVKVLWRGWTRLQDIVATYTLLQPPKDMGNA